MMTQQPTASAAHVASVFPSHPPIDYAGAERQARRLRAEAVRAGAAAGRETAARAERGLRTGILRLLASTAAAALKRQQRPA